MNQPAVAALVWLLEGITAQLDPNRSPSDVQAKRWLRFIDDVGHFLDSRFCAIAASLDWGPYDLFGCDRDQALARIDQAGLLSVLNGNRIVALARIPRRWRPILVRGRSTDGG